MKIRQLTIVEAWELFEIIKDVFPKNYEELELIDFLSDFISKMAKDSPQSFDRMNELFFGEKEIKIPMQEYIEYLLEVMSVNKVVSLYDFYIVDRDWETNIQYILA